MTGPMGNPRQPAGFAISDILELDRNSNVGMDQPPDAPLYNHPAHDIGGYVPISRHWTTPPEGKELLSVRLLGSIYCESQNIAEMCQVNREYSS